MKFFAKLNTWNSKGLQKEKVLRGGAMHQCIIFKSLEILLSRKLHFLVSFTPLEILLPRKFLLENINKSPLPTSFQIEIFYNQIDFR